VDAARCELAAAVRASDTSLTGLFGVGPVIAAIIIGDVRDVSRFVGRDNFAAYNDTPIKVSSGQRKVYRLSRHGNRRIYHGIHMAAITQVRQRHSEGRTYYDKKLAEGKTHREALRSVKCELLQGSFVPPADIKAVRDVIRYRVKVVHARTSETQRLGNVLQEAQLTELRDGSPCPAGWPARRWPGFLPVINSEDGARDSRSPVPVIKPTSASELMLAPSCPRLSLRPGSCF
jgi:hypothetical protein